MIRSANAAITKRTAPTLHESDGGFIYLPSLDGFEQFLTHVGPVPGMKVVDTDQLP